MVQKLFQFLSLSCRHNKLTKPFAAAMTQTAVGSDWGPVTEYTHYVVCLECGKKMAYDWSNMRVIK